jgi:hypothetical protein
MSGDYYGVGSENITGKFDNPFLLPSSSYFPKTLTEALDLCRFFYFRIPNYKQVQRRIVRYFITDFEFPGEDGDLNEKEKLRSYLENVLDLKQKMIEMGDEWGCYGNGFMRIAYPFKRFLVDDRESTSNYYPIESFEKFEAEGRVKFNLKDLAYTVPDPATKYKTEATFQFIDKKDKDKNNIKLIIMDPRYIRIQYNAEADKARYIYSFNPKMRAQVNQGVTMVINTTPKYMLEAIKDNKDIMFKEGEVFHFRSPLISGISYSGWGLSEIIANYQQCWQLLLYMKADEAICLDYIMPFRIFSMEPQNSGGDVMQNSDALFFTSQMSQIIASRRKDKFAIHAVPFPINYQEFGGNGKTYTPKETIEYQNNVLLNGCGYFSDLYQGTMQVNIVPTALRLIQNTHYFLYNGYNKMAKWVVKKVLDYAEESMIEVQMQEPRIADNLENANIKTRLVMDGTLPWDVIGKDLGISNPVDALVRRIEQDQQVQQRAAEKEEEMKRKQVAQDLLKENLEDPGMAGGGGGPAGSTPIFDMYQKAVQTAQQWEQMPIGQRRQAMEMTQQQDFQLYAMAERIMQENRRNMQRQGAQMIREQSGMAPSQ